MNGQTEIFSIDPGDASAKRQRVTEIKLTGSLRSLVSVRDGFWMGVSDFSRGVCGDRVMWLGRDATAAVIVGEPSCLSGPKRSPVGGAIWATQKTFSHPMSVVVAKGSRSDGLVQLPHSVAGSFEAITLASDGVVIALDDGEVVLQSLGSKYVHIAPALSLTPTATSRALGAHGDHVYLASSQSKRQLDLFRLPRKGGKRDKLATFDLQHASVELYATEGSVVLHVSRDKAPPRALLVDPRGVCPTADLPPSDATHGPIVDRGVVYALRPEGITATSIAARAAAPPDPPAKDAPVRPAAP